MLYCFEMLNYFSALSYFSQAVAAAEVTLKDAVFMSVIDLNSPAPCVAGSLMAWHLVQDLDSQFLEAWSREPVGLL